MNTQAAICWERKTPWSVEEIELDPPKHGEVLVKLAASGLCHSDEHIVQGEFPFALPIVGGHEGAGVIQEVGPGVTGLAPGDHLVFGFIAACGRCRSCSSGRQNLCELGMFMAEGQQLSDHTSRHHARGQDLRTTCMLGTFAEYTVVNEANCIKIEKDVSLDVAALLGCGVVTGWGAAVNTGQVSAGDTVVVIGVGGVGMNAVQGAALAGAERVIAVDPSEYKRDLAPTFGATHVAEDADTAFELVRDLTRGRLADVAVSTKGVGHGPDVAEALRLVGKRGRAVVVNVHPPDQTQVDLNVQDLVLFEKQLRGSLFGSSNPRADIPRLLELYRNGKLKLDELITHRYKLSAVNDGYDDMLASRSLRGVIVFGE